MMVYDGRQFILQDVQLWIKRWIGVFVTTVETVRKSMILKY